MLSLDTILLILAVPTLLSFTQYIAILVYRAVFCGNVQNLKMKYGSTWAFVSGASSGIGKAITETLAAQGINVVLAALDDRVFEDTMKELKKKFPEREFVKVPVDLSKADGGYMNQIISATERLPINLVFNNAGYIKMGHFVDLPLDAQLGNYECNSTAAIRISHYFMNKLVDSKTKGLVAFTSSSASFFPSPTSAMYGSTKSFLTSFACSVAAEVKDLGIDVLVVHPSPIASNFYKGSEHVDSVQFFKKTAAGPQVIADAIFRGAGKLLIWDQGYFSILVRFLFKILDWCAFSELMSRTATLNADHAKLRKQRKAQ
jgi:short-subunit dehydrogenase